MEDDGKSGYAGPYPTAESRGIDRGYEAVRGEAKEELAKTMAGPRHPLETPKDSGLKNPGGEFETPAPMVVSHPNEDNGPGPNQVGNSSGHGRVDPQGQQGGTEGGQSAVPAISTPGRSEGTPLASPKERAEQSRQRPGAGVDEEF